MGHLGTLRVRVGDTWVKVSVGWVLHAIYAALELMRSVYSDDKLSGMLLFQV